jgi:hypothetical protein
MQKLHLVFAIITQWTFDLSTFSTHSDNLFIFNSFFQAKPFFLQIILCQISLIVCKKTNGGDPIIHEMTSHWLHGNSIP